MSSSGKTSATPASSSSSSATKFVGAPQRQASIFSPPPRRQREVAVPEWKLGCLTTEYGLPPTMRGTLQTGGYF